MAEGHDPASKVGAVRRLLAQIVRRHPDAQDVVDKINGLLDGLPGTDRRPVHRRTGEGVRYEVRTVGKRPMLYEVRPAGAPLRIGRDLYDTVVDVLAATTKPLSYDEITDDVEARTGAALGDWQGRVLLRFFQQSEPPLVLRSRSRYRPVDSARFAAAARKRWDETAKV